MAKVIREQNKSGHTRRNCCKGLGYRSNCFTVNAFPNKLSVVSPAGIAAMTSAKVGTIIGAIIRVSPSGLVNLE